MQRYRVTGTITIEYSYRVNEEIEAENEDDAIDAICEDLDPLEAFDAHTEASVKVTPIEDEAEVPEDRRMRALGMPMLPGFA